MSLQVMAETFSQAGVPCFMADMKGDLSGISQVGKMSGFIEKRLPEFFPNGQPDGQPIQFASCPVRLYDVYGEQGHPMRATISDMGPDLLSRLLGLNDVQAGVLTITFRVADERGLLLIDIKDLRMMLEYVSRNLPEYITTYGNMTKQSIGAISRSLVSLEEQGGDFFFGEPEIDIKDWMRQDAYGRGFINVLHCVKLIHSPKLYATFMLWLLSELFESLPEEGDLEKPKMVFRVKKN